MQKIFSLKKIFSFKLGFIILFILLVLNVVLLNIFVLQSGVLKEKQKSEFVVTKINPSLTETVSVVKEPLCPNSCLSQIYQATSSLKLAPTIVEKTTSQQSVSAPSQSSGVKEFFVPLSSGSNSTDDWADVLGAQAYIDSTQYGQIKSVVFEASVHIPTGNEIAYVRLFNVTDKHPVWFSEVSLEGGTPKLLISNPITLDSGRKLYQVQMKTSLKYQAILDQARVHIAIY